MKFELYRQQTPGFFPRIENFIPHKNWHTNAGRFPVRNGLFLTFND
jgi:hypothetical protein